MSISDFLSLLCPCDNLIITVMTIDLDFNFVELYTRPYEEFHLNYDYRNQHVKHISFDYASSFIRVYIYI